MPAAPSTVARAQQTSWGRAGTVWDLYDDQDRLIGWTLDIPPRSMTVRPAFDYHTGHIVPVDYTPLTRYLPLT